MKEVVAVIVALLARIALASWLFMITVGIVRAEWLHELPTIGFVAALGVSTMLSLAYGALFGSTLKES